MTILLQDLRFALRQLRKSPGFTIAAVLTLALAIGANAVVFGVMNALILRPLNVPQAESLFIVQHGKNSGPTPIPIISIFASAIAASTIWQLMPSLRQGWIRAQSIQRLGDRNQRKLLRRIGIQPYLGRFFHASDEHGPNSAPYIVLSYAYWHSHFQDDRGVVGRVVRLNKHPYTIIGVAPPGFQGHCCFSPRFLRADRQPGAVAAMKF